ncbi:MAG: zinc ribbon domain-containing protein [Candidatus Tectimicrobiota bacterium]
MAQSPHDKPVSPGAAEATLRQQHEAFHVLMQECLECRKDIEPHWQFCAHCGIRLATSCPGCGNPLPPAGAQTCPSCALPLPQTPA